MRILGINALYHDPAAALVVDGEVVAAAQEERFTRRKHDADLPVRAMAEVLALADVPDDGIDLVAYYDKPLTTFGRVVRSFVDAGPAGFRAFPGAMASWARTKLWTGLEIERGLASIGYAPPRRRTVFAEHHVSHAAAAFRGLVPPIRSAMASSVRRSSPISCSSSAASACTSGSVASSRRNPRRSSAARAPAR